MIPNAIENYYESFFDRISQKNISLPQLINFYENYPYCVSRVRAVVDYEEYFNQLTPKIESDIEAFKTTPPKLNVWEGIELGNSELKHCSFLSWLFDKNANHYQRELFLDCFLDYMAAKYQNSNFYEIIEFVKNDYYIVTKEDYYKYYKESGRVDIFIKSKNFMFIIEAKIQALEQDNQIERYLNILGQQATSNNIKNNHCKMFFLTPDGRKPVSLNNISTSFSDIDVISIGWKDVAVIVNNFSKKCKNKFVSQLSKQYSNFILNHLWR